jgi:hypothetical protein
MLGHMAPDVARAGISQPSFPDRPEQSHLIIHSTVVARDMLARRSSIPVALPGAASCHAKISLDPRPKSRDEPQKTAEIV